MRLSGWAVFDLDGTLVDTLDEITAALNRVLRRRSREGLSREKVRDLIGHGPNTLLERAWSCTGLEANKGEVENLAHEYAREYDQNPVGMSRPYPGVNDGVQRLFQRGWKLGVCTNKDGTAARALVRNLGWEKYFPVVISGEETFRKPDPRPLRQALDRLGAGRGRHLFVGDSAVDLQTAQNAGIESIFLEHGYGQRGGYATRVFANAVDMFRWLGSAGPLHKN